MKVNLFFLVFFLLLPLATALTIEQGVLVETLNATWNFSQDTTLDNITVGAEYVRFNNDNVSFVPNASTNISIISWSDSSNNFSTTQGPLTIPFVIKRGSILAYIRSLSTDYYSTFTPLSTQYFSYAFTGNMSIRFYHTNGTLINNSVDKNITIVSNLSSALYQTSQSIVNISQLVPNFYEVRVYAQDFNPSHKFITVNAESTSTINFYLELNTTSTESQKFQVQDTSGANVEGAIIRVQKELTNTTGVYKTVDEAITGPGGITYIWLEKDRDVYYRFSVILDGVTKTLSPSGELWTTKQSFISGVDDTIQLIIMLSEGGSGSLIEETTGVTTSLDWVDNLTITYTWTDALNAISGARLELWGKFLDSNNTLQLISTNTSTDFTGSLSYTFTPINNTYYEIRGYIIYNTYEQLYETATKTFSINVKVDKNTGLLVAGILLVVMAFLTIKWGPLVSATLAFASLAVSKTIGFIDWPTTIITSLIVLVIIILLRPKNEG